MNFKLVIFHLLIFSSFNIFGQTVPIKDVHITLAPLQNPINDLDSSDIMDSYFMDSVFFDFYNNEDFATSVSVLLSDTVNISKIHVKLGRTEGNYDIFDNYFIFDQSQPIYGSSYTREKMFVTMELGTFNNIGNLYCQVFIIKANGGATAPFYKTISLIAP